MELVETLSKISDLYKEWTDLQPLSKEHDDRLWEKMRLEWNYNSNHIEGNTLTYGETMLLLIFDKTTGDHELREFEEMKAHDVAIHVVKEWSKDNREITEADIRSLNEIILVRPYWKEALTYDGQETRRKIKVGEYKEFSNSVRLKNGEMFHYASPEDVPKLMQDLLAWYREHNTTNPLVLAAELHYKFIRIHPFDDGNGRVARLLVNYVLMKHNYPPLIVKSDDKMGYLTALQKADSGNIAAFVDYMAEQLIWSLELALKAAKGENIDEPEDLDKKLSLLEKELHAIDPDNEVRIQLSKEVFNDIYKTWVRELFKEAIFVVQKFNGFFTGSNHGIYVHGAYISFVNQAIDDILEKLDVEVLQKNEDNFKIHDVRITLTAWFGSFVKGGLNTFGCSYGFEIRFDINKYEILVDEFSENTNSRKLVKITERLLHKPLTKTDIDNIVTKLGDTIFKHIDYYTKKNGIR